MSVDTTGGKPGLKRVLGLRELVLYGIILVQPTAAMPLYGNVADKAHGHVVTTILIGMVAMLFTAISYGRMANAYPTAGSAYSYVGQELHSSLGYLTGWAMVFDYVLNPIISVIWCSGEAMKFLPEVPYPLWAVFFAVLFTGLNLRGIKASARTNQWMAGGLTVVVALFLAAAVRYVCSVSDPSPGRFLLPFYNPQTFSLAAVSHGASLAMLTYIGFDAISTLSEEAHNPRRNILLATVLTCLITGILCGAQVYAAQLVWPESAESFKNLDTAIVDVAGRAGGALLMTIVGLALLVAQTCSGAGAHLAAGRLLYGMGRDNAIPSRFFAALAPRTRIPRNNIVLVGVLALAGAFAVSFEIGCEMLNFGALIGFMGVNLSAFVRYYLRGNRSNPLNLVLPLAGFLICLYLWWSLSPLAKIVGLSWLATGFLYGAWKTNWFRRKIEFTVPDEETILPRQEEPSHGTGIS
ncbi:MAG: APC family permease [Thermoguttaceae bacterium]|jgi:amino acid transporter